MKTAVETVNEAALLELRKAVPTLKKLARNKTFARALAKEGYRIDLGAVRDMEKLLESRI